MSSYSRGNRSSGGRGNNRRSGGRTNDGFDDRKTAWQRNPWIQYVLDTWEQLKQQDPNTTYTQAMKIASPAWKELKRSSGNNMTGNRPSGNKQNRMSPFRTNQNQNRRSPSRIGLFQNQNRMSPSRIGQFQNQSSISPLRNSYTNYNSNTSRFNYMNNY